MATPAPTRGYTSEHYFRLVDEGVLRPDDRVELLEGLIVAVSPQNPLHAAVTGRADAALRAAIGTRGITRVQMPLVIGRRSVPEPDIAVVPGRHDDYERAHPTTALLVVEVADASLAQDRLTKAAMYAAAGIPECWLVNLRDDCVEVFRVPERPAARYAERRVAARGERLEIVALPGASVLVDELVPHHRP